MKIAVLGCENSHANTFLKLITEKKEEFGSIEVLGVYSREEEPCRKLREKFGVPVLSDPEEAVGLVDGVVITARHGDDHLPLARPFLDSGVPLFLDKPITKSQEDAFALQALLEEKKIRVTGGSCLKHTPEIQKLKEEVLTGCGGKTLGGFVRAPLMRESPYGQFSFYAQHLIEMVTEIYGNRPLSVSACDLGDTVHVTFRYENYAVTGIYCDQSYHYSAARLSEAGTNFLEIPLNDEIFYREFSLFCDLLKGGEMKGSYDDFFAPVFIMNAIERAIKSGKEERIAYGREKS